MNLAHWYTSEISVTVFYFMARSPAGLSSLVRKTINCPQFVLDSDSNLVVSWLVGGRDSGYAMELMDDLAKRLANRVQLNFCRIHKSLRVAPAMVAGLTD